MKCRGCGYCLFGIASGPCPECGRIFDRCDPATFIAENAVERSHTRRLLQLLTLFAVGLVAAWIIWKGRLPYRWEFHNANRLLTAVVAVMLSILIIILFRYYYEGRSDQAGSLTRWRRSFSYIIKIAVLVGLFASAETGTLWKLMFRIYEHRLSNTQQFSIVLDGPDAKLLGIVDVYRDGSAIVFRLETGPEIVFSERVPLPNNGHGTNFSVEQISRTLFIRRAVDVVD